MQPLPDGLSTDRRLDSLIIALAAGAVLGVILIAQGRRTDKGFTHPMHSPNDRSRFATIRALGDQGTYAIGRLQENGQYEPGSVVAEQGWDTIDKVRRPDNGLIYSSKPPLLPTLLAYEYRLIKWLSAGRLNFADHPLAVVRIIVASVNWLPLVVFLFLYARLLDSCASDSWVRNYSLAAAAVGTYLSGFSVTLNNHTIAAFSAFFALYPAYVVWCKGRQQWWLFALSGLFAGFTAALELPAAALLAVLFMGLMWKQPRTTLCCFLPLALLPLAGHVWTNYLITGDWTPAYEHKEWYEFSGSYWKIDPETGRLVGTKTDPDTGTWVINRAGIDSQFESWHVYLFHMSIGHHGIFSLSPIFVFTVLGIVRVLAGPGREPLKPFALLAAGLTMLLLAFYTVAPAFGIGQRNYGGMCNGLRWLFWLIPLWLMILPVGLESKASCRWFRGIALACLVISAASAFYATRNPWTRPWLHEVLHAENLGLIKY
ncbi:MAG: hypothetical protein HY000_04315 [Planctomycetes bacterium]|nr:hypothetical protein [Planctomycetota bacterium]